MTPSELRRFIEYSPKPDNWTMTDAYQAWRRYIDDLGEKYHQDLKFTDSSAEDAFRLAKLGADPQEIASVYTLLFL